VTLKGSYRHNRSVGEIADPAGFQHPRFLRIQPTRARRVNPPAHLEGGGIQLDNAEAAKEFLRGVEEIVIVDLVVFSKDPALRARVGLRGAAFDLVAQGIPGAGSRRGDRCRP